MLVNICAAKCIGIDAVKVTVEIDVDRGVGIHLVGLADTAVKESLLRTTTALQALQYKIPGRRIVINLAPADLHKSGSGYDLPIAIGIVAATGQAEFPSLGDFLIMGELGLDGSVRAVPGGLPFAELALKSGLGSVIFPEESAMEAMEMEGVKVYAVRDFREVVRILSGVEDCSDLLVGQRSTCRPAEEEEYVDFADIIGQEGAKRGTEIAAAGGHNVVFIGVPGSGKSSLAKAVPGILPKMTREEAIVTSKIYSIAGKVHNGLIWKRPFRSPHYSVSLAAIVGGGNGDNVSPGEVTLAQNGVLFLDEMGQMSRSVIEALRGPIEDRTVTISRLRSRVTFPSSFMLVAASNPCPCGYYGEGDRCNCTPTQRMNYLSKLSGPILDRIDIQLWMRPVASSSLSERRKGESSAEVAARVMAARKIQTERFRNEPITVNAEMNNKQIEKYCPLSEECQKTLTEMMDRMGMSMRAYFRIIKVARTIADLAGAERIEPSHLIEAAGFRFLDRK